MEAGNIFAGISADGKSGAELLYLAPVGTKLPTKDAPFAPLDTAFQSVGLITPDGFSLSQDVSKEEIFAYGLLIAVRTLKTQMKQEGSVTMMETNPRTLEVYNGLPLNSIVPDAQGNFAVETGKIRTQQYAAVISATDGERKARWCMPKVEFSPSGELKLSMGAILERPVSMSMAPDELGNAVYEYYGIPSAAPSGAVVTPTP